jgi:hypothetical protein
MQERETRSAQRQLIRKAVALSVISAALFAVVPILFGSPERAVEVRWRSTSESARRAVERQLRLTGGSRVRDDVWLYVPGDTSRESLRRIISHPLIEDTTGIDRRELSLTRSTPLTSRRGGLISAPPTWGARVTRLAALLAGVVAFLLCFGAAALSPRVVADSEERRIVRALFFAPSTALPLVPGAARKWLERGVPVATAEAAGLFRLVFGSCAVAYVWHEGVDANQLQSSAVASAQGLYGAVVGWLAAHPAVVARLDETLLVTGLLFIAGIFTTAAFAGFVAAFLLWACVFTLGTTTHAVATLALTLVCLIPARWGDALSVDGWIRARRGQVPLNASRRYGYAFWIPRLALGLAFLAAAWSKLRGGPDWILNGTVKYHFITDFDHALVSWGPLLTGRHSIAVLLSAGAVVAEAVAITAAFSRSDLYRMIVVVMCMALLAGFALFQGVQWWGWWILLLAYLPWQRFHAAVPAPTQAAALAPVQSAAAILLLIQQLAVSAAHLEARPILSAYDMYSASYGSVDEYEASVNLVYRVVFIRGNERVELTGCTVSDRAAAAVPAAANGNEQERAYLRGLIGECARDIDPAAQLVLEGDRRIYDWDQRRFTWRRGVGVVGPVSAEWLGRPPD